MGIKSVATTERDEAETVQKVIGAATPLGVDEEANFKVSAERASTLDLQVKCHHPT